MSKLYIREFTQMAKVQSSKDDIAAPLEPGVDQTPIVLSGSSQQSAEFATATRFIALTSDGIFSYKVGVDPTVTTDALRIVAGQLIYLGVFPGHKVSAIANT